MVVNVRSRVPCRLNHGIVTGDDDEARNWLAARLRAAGALTDGEVAALSVKPFGKGFLADIRLLEIRYSAQAKGDLPSRLIAKQSNSAFSFVELCNEIDCYDRLQSSLPGYMPRCFGSEIQAESAVLLIEYLQQDYLTLDWGNGETPSLDTLKRMLSALAQCHACFWEADFQNQLGQIRCTPEWVRSQVIQFDLEQLCHSFVQRLGDRATHKHRLAYRSLPGAFMDRFCDYLEAGTCQTAIHGDAHFWNFLLPVNPDGQVVLLDWASWKVDLAVEDLVYMIILKTPPGFAAAHESELIEHYLICMHELGVDYPKAMLNRDWNWALARSLVRPVIMAEVVPGAVDQHWLPMLEAGFDAIERRDCWDLLLA